MSKLDGYSIWESGFGRFLLQARWSGTRFQIFYVTLRFPKILLDDL